MNGFPFRWKLYIGLAVGVIAILLILAAASIYNTAKSNRDRRAQFYAVQQKECIDANHIKSVLDSILNKDIELGHANIKKDRALFTHSKWLILKHEEDQALALDESYIELIGPQDTCPLGPLTP